VIIADGVDVVFPDMAAVIDARWPALVGHRDGGERTVLLITEIEADVRELLVPDPGLFERVALLVGGVELVVAMNHDRVLRVGMDLDELPVDPGPQVFTPVPLVVAGWTAHSADGRAWPELCGQAHR
jgi:hypothetical protein